MKKGDCVKSKGIIVQIATVNSTYMDQKGNILLDVSNIKINDDVLLACKFNYEKEDNCYELQIGRNRIIIGGTRNQGGKYCCMICSPRTPPHAPDTSNHIVTLADLQDFVRICTSEELPINVTELADAIK